MKLQVSLVVIIAALSAYIYLTRGPDNNYGQLLGASSTWERHWRNAKGNTNYPSHGIFKQWIGALASWHHVHGQGTYPPKEIDLRKWKVAYDRVKNYHPKWIMHWNNAKGANAEYPKTEAEFKAWITALSAWHDVFGRNKYPPTSLDLLQWRVDYEEERKAKDPCEWIKRNKR